MTDRLSLPHYHLRTEEDLQHVELPGGYRWTASRWRLPLETPGISPAETCIRWDIALGDGSKLTDARHHQLLSASRRIVWCALSSPPKGLPRKYSALSVLQGTLAKLLTWMTIKGYSDFSFLTHEAISEYVDYIADWVAFDPIAPSYETADEDALATARRRPRGAIAISPYFRIIEVVISARDALKGAGLPFPDALDPFRGSTSFQLALTVIAKACNITPEMPAALFAKITNAALGVVSAPHEPLFQRMQALAARRTSAVPEPFDKPRRTADSPGVSTSLRNTGCRFDEGLYREVNELLAASAILLHGLVAIRPSELAGLRVGSSQPVVDAQGLAEETMHSDSVKVRLSYDGNFEIFYLHGHLYKWRQVPEPVEWVLGLRPVGASFVPPPVKAVEVIAALFKHWRPEFGIDDLFVRPTYSGEIKPMLSSWMRQWQAQFIKKYRIDVRQFERTITPQIWRKTFARAIVRFNPELLPAITNHLQHMSMAVTERAYINPNPGTTDIWTGVHVRQAGAFISEFVTGNQKVEGPVRQALEEVKANLRLRLSNLDEAMRLQQSAAAVRAQAMSLYDTHFGACLFRSDGANCVLSHEHVAAPLLARRSPEICVACRNFAVTPDHQRFWETRRADLEAQLQALPSGDPIERVVRSRLNSCKVVLRWLGANDGKAQS